MTDEQKDILIAKIIDDPRSLSDHELDMILHDDELSDICRISSELNGALATQPHIDIKAEWKRFRPFLAPRVKPWRRVLKAAAILSGVVLISAITMMLLNSIRDDGTASDPTILMASADNPDRSVELVPVAYSDTDSDNEIQAPPTSKADRQSPASVRKLSARNPSTVSVQTESTEIDIDEYVRIQQAKIDNDLALIAAKEYEEEYGKLLAYLESIGIDTSGIENEMQEITMQ